MIVRGLRGQPSRSTLSLTQSRNCEPSSTSALSKGLVKLGQKAQSRIDDDEKDSSRQGSNGGTHNGGAMQESTE
jgi:hypothetical protein